jgi:hypothetical protein
MAVIAVTAATVAVPVTNGVGLRTSVAAAKAAKRSNDGRYDMVVLRWLNAKLMD